MSRLLFGNSRRLTAAGGVGTLAAVVLLVLCCGPAAAADPAPAPPAKPGQAAKPLAKPLYEEEPFDRVTLTSGEVVKIKPIRSLRPGPVDPRKRNGMLEGVFPLPPEQQEGYVPPPPAGQGGKAAQAPPPPEEDKSETKHEVAWRLIARYQLFEELVLDKAKELVEEGKKGKATKRGAPERYPFEEAYDYFKWLEQNEWQTPGRQKANEDFLYVEAEQSYLKGQRFADSKDYDSAKVQYESALALLREIYRREIDLHTTPRPKLDQVLAATTDKLVDRYVQEQDYASARALLRNLAQAFPKHPTVDKWTAHLQKQAAELLDAARAAVDKQQWRQAGELSRHLTVVWPELPGARELALTLQKKYPRVVVGVTALNTSLMPGRLDDWASRRASRLVYRTLTEFAGPSTEGGKYDCPVGEISSAALGHRLHIRLKPDIRWAEGDATLTNSDLARRLLSMADPESSCFQIDWADVMTAISVQGVYDLEVELHRAHVRPEAMLRIVLTPHAAVLKPGELPPLNGPFVAPSRTSANNLPEEDVFVANRQYFAEEAGRPLELVERRYESVAQAIKALKRGDIQVVDRVNPWSLAALRKTAHVKVQPYAQPLVHCLIPNLRRPMVEDRNFRRALVYGINREELVSRMFSGINLPAGCGVTSSPFPSGVGATDPMSYASDDTIKPRPYEPRLAAALVAAVQKQQADALLKAKADALKAKAKEQNKDANKEPAKEEAQEPNKEEAKEPGKEENKEENKEQPPKKKPPRPRVKLVMAHPADEIARAACASIQMQLAPIGIDIELRPLRGALPDRVPDDVDLLYVELATWEPAVDARRILGEHGIAGGGSPYMSLALRQLDEAVEWSRVRNCLRRIHRIAFDDVAIMPLWQVVEHYAYHESLKGIAARPVSLYQNIEQWRLVFQYSTEQ